MLLDIRGIGPEFAAVLWSEGWNTRYLELALADMGTARHIAPLGWEHISLTGDYSWNSDDRPGPDQLRTLRATQSLLAA